MRVGLYARTSTTHHGQNCDVQLIELREYAKRRGWLVVSEYVDNGISGGRERRPELDRLWSHCRRRKVDCVLVYRYDRFARSLRQLVNALCEFDALGIQFASLHEGVDTSTPGGKLVFGIFASIAEFEKELIRSRVCSGISAARLKGKKLGRPQVPVDVAQVMRLRASGASWRAVAEQMGIGLGTARRAAAKCAKKLPNSAPVSS